MMIVLKSTKSTSYSLIKLILYKRWTINIQKKVLCRIFGASTLEEFERVKCISIWFCDFPQKSHPESHNDWSNPPNSMDLQLTKYCPDIVVPNSFPKFWAYNPRELHHRNIYFDSGWLRQKILFEWQLYFIIFQKHVVFLPNPNWAFFHMQKTPCPEKSRGCGMMLPVALTTADAINQQSGWVDS